MEWVDVPPIPNQGVFFNNSEAIQSYLNYVEHFVTRTNYFTNVKYSEEPAILAWEVMNEPRHQNLGDDLSSVTLRAWMDSVGKFIKNLDSNHLISSGIEGHGKKYHYGGNEGNNFQVIHSSPYIDICTAHLYPQTDWINLSPSETSHLIQQWEADSKELGKPFFIGEFNVPKANREIYWKTIFETVESLDIAGDLFWWFEYDDIDPKYGVTNNDTILKVFKKHSEVMKYKNQ